MTREAAATNGLANWRRRQREEKALRLAELAAYRRDATTEVHDGRTFTVVRIPDRYGEGRAA